MSKENITFKDYLAIEEKLSIKIGKIVNSERVPKSEKLLKLSIDFGDGTICTCVTNIGEFYEPEHVLDLTAPFITNLEPNKLMGILSEVMIVCGKTPNNELKPLVGLDNLIIGSELI